MTSEPTDGRSRALHTVEGYVSAVRTENGGIVVDVLGYQPVFRLKGVRVLEGIGLPESFAHLPPMMEAVEVQSADPHPPQTQNPKVVVLMSGAYPVCVLGCSHNEGERPNIKLTDQPIATSATSDRTTTPSIWDATIKHRGGFASVSHDGSVSVDVKASEQPRVRVQLPSSGQLRVSRGGECGEQVALANALQTYLNGTSAAANEITTALVGGEGNGWLYDLWKRIIALETVINALIPAMNDATEATKLAVQAGVPIPIPLQVNVTSAVAVEVAVAVFEATTGLPMPPPPNVPNSIRSAALRVSDDSE